MTEATRAPAWGTARRWAVAAVAVVSTLLLAAVVLRELPGFTGRWVLQYTPMTLLFVVASTAVIARPRHISAWALFGMSTVSVVENFGYGYGLYPTYFEVGPLPGAFPALILALGLQSARWTFLPLLLLSFPAGVLRSRQLILAAVAMAVPVITSLMVFVTPHADYGPHEPAAITVARHYGITTVYRGAWIAFQVSMVAAAVWIFLRGRRGGMVARQQTKWLAVGILPLVVVQGYLSTFGEGALEVWWFLYPSMEVFTAIAIAVAITRYRLFDVDRFIAKTVLYGSFAAVIALVYAGIVGIATMVVGASSTSPTLSLIAAIAAALSLLPLQSHLRHLANLLVFGRRATPYETLSSFMRALGKSLGADEILPTVARAVAAGTGAGGVKATVYSRHGDRSAIYGSDPTPAAHRVAVRLGDEELGEITVARPDGETFTSTEIALLVDVATHAGPAFRNVALTAELEKRLEEITVQATELERSRERIVEAQDAERRRIERDLHDGAQQNLVSLSGQLRLLTKLLDEQPRRAKMLADRLVEESMATLDQIRDLARGVFPQILTDAGVVAALRAHLVKFPGRVGLEVDPKLETMRFDPTAEVAVYFCFLEALQNALKHGEGKPVTIMLEPSNGDLRFTIADRGPGFDPTKVPSGAGINNMRDRLAAVGGTFSISSSVGEGTVVAGSVPLDRHGAHAHRARSLERMRSDG